MSLGADPVWVDGHHQPYRITLTRRMADAVTALNHPGTEVRRSDAGRLWLRSDDPEGFMAAAWAYRGDLRFAVRDVAVKVRLAREADVRMRGPLR